MNLKKLLGGSMFVTGVLGILLSVTGFMAGFWVVNDMQNRIDSVLLRSIQTLQTTRSVIDLSTQTVTEVQQGINTVQETTNTLSQTITDTRPFLGNIGEVTTESIPTSLDAVTAALPNVAASAATIDDVLTALSSFQYKRTIFGAPFEIDLGIDYAPVERFDVSVNRIGTSLEGTPAQLRALDLNFQTADTNLLALSTNLTQIGTELNSLERTVTDLNPLLDQYLLLVDQTLITLADSRTQIAEQLVRVKIFITLVMIWFGLIQTVPLYLGYHLILDKGILTTN
ncbi:MAG TPA: hypothetical protein VLL52_13560 [Anaerolineae bacterium]|nr:hypothetical protein [Anaerolineae bacterium]